MRLYFLRHGAADWPNWNKPDDQRPLTVEGRRELHQVAEFLARLKVSPDVILTSPLPRAAQTAEIAAQHLRAPVRQENILAPGFGAAKLRQLQKSYPRQTLMLIGHEPDFTEVIAALTGASVKLSKGGVALIDLEVKGRLLWLFPAKLAKA